MVRENQIPFLCLQETHVSSLSSIFIRNYVVKMIGSMTYRRLWADRVDYARFGTQLFFVPPRLLKTRISWLSSALGYRISLTVVF